MNDKRVTGGKLEGVPGVLGEGDASAELESFHKATRKPMRNHTLRVGSQYHVVRKEVVIEPWTVTEVSSDGVTLTNADGDTVSLYRVAP